MSIAGKGLLRMYDVIVIGGGPAGMTAALYALRNGKSVLVIEKEGFGGQITHSPKVENYPGSISISGNELADKMLDQILQQGAEIEFETVNGIQVHNTYKTVSTEEGNQFECKAVIIATGVKHRLLGLPGEKELIGEGISFCAVCDGDFYTDKTVCVVGGGNSALQEAILLAGKCRKVIILQDLPELTGESRLQDVLAKAENVQILKNQSVKEYLTEDSVFIGVCTESKIDGTIRSILCDGLFLAIGLIPENEPFQNVAKLNSVGYFDSDERCTTETPGIYVAGDCRSKQIRQITTAASDGAVAALAACRFIDTMQ